MPAPYQQNATVLDLGPRVYRSGTVAASPADDTETVIATLTVTPDLAYTKGVVVQGFAAFTVGTDGTSFALRVRKTSVAGSVLKSTGLIGATAADLAAPGILAFDTGPTLPNQVYVLTLTVTAASAASTVSAVELFATVV